MLHLVNVTAAAPLANDPALITCAIVAGIMDRSSVTIVYRDSQGVGSVRYIEPRTIERCDNGNTIVRAYDIQRKACRSFTLENVQAAAPTV